MFVNGGIDCQRRVARVLDFPAERKILREHFEQPTSPEVVKEALLERPLWPAFNCSTCQRCARRRSQP
jgi:hypothetical protein